jgi:hippurate hydrolase
MATLVGFAILLQQKAHLLPMGTCVRLLFQPAEEGPGGALPMVQEGCLDSVDEVYGYHNYGFPLGNLRVRSGPVMAHEQDFCIEIHGRGGHGSSPNLCIDPIVIASQIVNAVQTIVSRNVSPHESAVVSIGQLHAGQVNTVIPAIATLGGTMRDFTPSVAALLRSRLEEIVHGICALHGATAVITYAKSSYPAVVNAATQTEIVQTVAASISSIQDVSSEGLPLLAAEDFSYFLQERPGCFFFLGTKESCETQHRDLHSDTYDFNDKVLPLAIHVFLKIVEHRFNCVLFAQGELDSFLSYA